MSVVDLAEYVASESPGPSGPHLEARDGVVVVKRSICRLTPAAARTLAANLIVLAETAERQRREA